MIINVGIDISKYKHDYCIISNNGEIIVENDSFENNKIGFQHFLNQLKSYNKSEIHIAFEATGHYSLNLELFLIDNGFNFMKVNPLIINKFLKARSLRRTKTDKADSVTIANYLMSVPYEPNSDLLYNIFTLKSLCRSRELLIKERSKFAVLLTNELDKSFPELKSFFNNKFSNTLLYILEKYTCAKHIASMRDYETLRKTSHGKFSYVKFAKLKELAKNTVGYSDSNSELLISTYVSIYNDFNNKIDPIEKQISTIINKLNPRMLSIPGIGEMSAATILSEYGDIKNFSSPNKMLAFAGLDPSISQSGTLQSEGKMVKHGSGHLRYALMNVALLLLNNSPEFYDYYLKKRSEGKCHRVALSHVCKKLVRIIYTLEKNDVEFNPSLLK
ncbi:MAG: IS110 family transposase [Clostridia bacterium]|nr:IS110 family transposase [Clostridia bacterium]